MIKIKRNFSFTLVAVIILSPLSIVMPSNASMSNEQHYSIDLLYDRGAISLLQLSLDAGTRGDEKYEDKKELYLADILSFSEKSLYKKKFGIPLEFIPIIEPQDLFGKEIDVQNFQPPHFKLDRTKFFLTIPYFSNAKSIDIFNPDGSLALSVDVSQYATNREQPVPTWYYAVSVLAVVLIFFTAWHIKRRKNTAIG